VQTYGIHKVVNPLNGNFEEDHVILEICSNGSLHSLSTFTKPYEECAAYVGIRQIALALQNVHRKQVLHLDIIDSKILICFKKEN
jgi:serine/threonine protein kinase